jgi:hypothetical protein
VITTYPSDVFDFTRGAPERKMNAARFIGSYRDPLFVVQQWEFLLAMIAAVDTIYWQ